MLLEDMHRHMFNSENRNQVLEFTVIDLKDKLDMKEERVNRESIDSRSRESQKEQPAGDAYGTDGGNQSPVQPRLSVIHETRKSSNVQDISNEDK